MKKKTYNLWWLLIVVIMVIGVTSLHYGTHTHHEPLHALYRKLYYLPILMSAFHFGFKGAMICSISCVVLYFPHLHCDWGADYLIKNADRTLEVIMYLIIAGITGAYSSHQKNLHEKLEQSHEDLKFRTEKLVKAQQTLQKHEKLHAVGLLGAGISHEIRNPLASLKGILEIILSSDGECSISERQEMGTIALKEVSRIQEILTRFLSLSREENLNDEEVDLKLLCQNILELTKAEARKRNVDTSLRLPAVNCMYIGPSGPIQQVLLNLLLNAIEMASSQIEIELIKASDNIQILVKDDGPGVKLGSESAIFDFFFTTRQDGSGLGLAISAELMHQLGGKVQLINNFNMTTFLMEFPSVIKFGDGGKHKVALTKVNKANL